MKKLLICATSIILFIELLDTTILYSCFVPIANDFGVNVAGMSLPILFYIVGTCIFIPTVSWLSTKFNKINIIVTSLIAFSICSLLCGISPDLYTLSLFRFLQGITISIAGSMSIIALLSVCTNQEIVQTMGIINIPALLGTAIGPFVGAIFSYYLSWRIAFFINFPLCLVIALLLAQLRSDTAFHLNPDLYQAKFDWPGFILISMFLVVISIGFERLSRAISVINLLPVLSGIILCVAYIVTWKIRRNPLSENNNQLLDLDVFRNTDFLFGVLVNIIARAAMCGMPVLLGIILQQLYGFSIIKSGFYLAIIAGASIIAKFLSSYMEMIGIYRTIFISSILTAFSIAFLSQPEFWITNGYLWAPCFLLGFTMSLLYTAMNSVMYLTLKKHEIPNASNIGSIIQQLGIGLGVVIAVGGFQLLASLHGAVFSIGNFHTRPFQMICYFLAIIMMLNFIVALSFRYFNKRNLLTGKTAELDLRYE